MAEQQSKIAIRSGLITLTRAISKMSEEGDDLSLSVEPSAFQHINICIESEPESAF